MTTETKNPATKPVLTTYDVNDVSYSVGQELELSDDLSSDLQKLFDSSRISDSSQEKLYRSLLMGEDVGIENLSDEFIHVYQAERQYSSFLATSINRKLLKELGGYLPVELVLTGQRPVVKVRELGPNENHSTSDKEVARVLGIEESSGPLLEFLKTFGETTVMDFKSSSRMGDIVITGEVSTKQPKTLSDFDPSVENEVRHHPTVEKFLKDYERVALANPKFPVLVVAVSDDLNYSSTAVSLRRVNQVNISMVYDGVISQAMGDSKSGIVITAYTENTPGSSPDSERKFNLMVMKKPEGAQPVICCLRYGMSETNTELEFDTFASPNDIQVARSHAEAMAQGQSDNVN